MEEKAAESIMLKLNLKELLIIFHMSNESNNILGIEKSQSNNMLHYLTLF